MKDSLNDIHTEIAEIQSRDLEGITKTSLVEIPEISEKDWETLKSKLYSGGIKVQVMTISPVSFQLLAAPSDSAGFKFFNILAIIVPVVALILAIC